MTLVYDTFMFRDELDLLEIRLNVLDIIVDTFILVEATKTHSGKDKPLVYEKNKERFSDFYQRIRHVIVDDLPDPEDGNRWIPENYQRNAILRCLAPVSVFTEKDIIMISDIDEIPDPLHAAKWIGDTLHSNPAPCVFNMDIYSYYLDCKETDKKWQGTTICQRKDLVIPQELRDKRCELPRIEAGWHFSYMGGVDAIVEKIEAFAHAEADTAKNKDRRNLAIAMAEGKNIYGREDVEKATFIKDIEGNSDYPQYLRDNLSKYQHLVSENYEWPHALGLN